MNTNPNFLTFAKQNEWEKYICERLNKKFLECRFTTSSPFENMYRHTDAFLCIGNNNVFRIDFKTVDWKSNITNKGANSNFVINTTCFPSNGCNNPTDIFVFVGEYAEYAFFVYAKDIFTNEIMDVINRKAYGKYEYFYFNKSQYDNGKDYIVIKNEYIREKALKCSFE